MQKALDARTAASKRYWIFKFVWNLSTPQNDAMEMKAVQTVFSDAAVALRHQT